jgi:hypothetical protein
LIQGAAVAVRAIGDAMLAHIVVLIVLPALLALHVAASFIVSPGAVIHHDGAKKFWRH